MKQITMDDTVGALCRDDYKGINNQYVDQGKVVVVESICGNTIRWLGGSAENRTTTGFRRNLWGGTENIVTEEKITSWDGKDVSPTLTAHNAGGSQRMPDKGNFTCVIEENRAVDAKNFVEGEVNGTLTSAAGHNTESNNVVRQRYAVRRLTPIECERLQGLPIVESAVVVDLKEERIMLWKWLDDWQESQSIDVLSVVEKCRKKLKPVGSAENDKSQETAWSAARNSLQNFPRTNRPAQKSVLTSCEENALWKPNLGVMYGGACNVEKNLGYHHQGQTISSAQRNASTNTTPENEIGFGVMGLHTKEGTGESETSGRGSSILYGKEITQLAKDAESIMTELENGLQFTIYDLTEIARKQDLTQQILSFCVANATHLYTLTGEQIVISLLGSEPFTLIDDKCCSDSARYKALGNGMSQPVADFVIRRIVEEVEGCED